MNVQLHEDYRTRRIISSSDGECYLRGRSTKGEESRREIEGRIINRGVALVSTKTERARKNVICVYQRSVKVSAEYISRTISSTLHLAFYGRITVALAFAEQMKGLLSLFADTLFITHSKCRSMMSCQMRFRQSPVVTSEMTSIPSKMRSPIRSGIELRIVRENRRNPSSIGTRAVGGKLLRTPKYIYSPVPIVGIQ